MGGLRRIGRWTGLMMSCLAIAACGSGENPVVPIDTIAPFVGAWEAEVFTFTSLSDPSVVADMTLDGSFTVVIEPSGNYQSTFVFGGIPIVEFGRMAVNGSTLTFTPNAGTPATSSYTFVTPDYLAVEGQRDFDFNLDGTGEPASMLQELRRD